MTPGAWAIQPARMARPGIGKPILLLAMLCAFLMPLSNPVAAGALTNSALASQFHETVDSVPDRQFIQQQIVHIATHPKTGVPFLTAFLTEAERLCQPNARQNPNLPSPNATSSLLAEASSIALPASLTISWRPSRMQIGMETSGRSDGMLSPPEPPPPKSASMLH